MDPNFLDHLAGMESIDLYNWLIDKKLIQDHQLCKHCDLLMKINLSKVTLYIILYLLYR